MGNQFFHWQGDDQIPLLQQMDALHGDQRIVRPASLLFGIGRVEHDQSD
jgi:hypothetical protein